MIARSPAVLCPRPGETYQVSGYWTGNFVGECISLSGPRRYAKAAVFEVIDPMRPLPRVRNRCPFPECVRREEHDGDHEFVPVRVGASIEIAFRNARLVRVPEKANAA